MQLVIDLIHESVAHNEFQDQSSQQQWQADFTQWAQACLATINQYHNNTYERAHICVLLTSKTHIQRLNNDFLGKNRSTNVLSFPSGSLTIYPTELSGDIALCPEVIAEEAQTFHINTRERLAHMFIHGLLHLAGLDHQCPETARAMESLESKTLLQLGFHDPWEDIQGKICKENTNQANVQ